MAGLTTTQSFSDGDTVTAAKLNNIIANCSIDDDAITTVKINDGDVTLAKMAALSVDTGQLVADSVQNAKLDNMAASTVKANATSGSANPTDVAVAANKLLVGTSDSINAVGFTTDLELDAADSAAADIQVADTLISGKSTVTVVPANDTVLVYDADGSGNKLGKATVTDMMQTLPAVTTTSGVVRLATAERSVDSTVAGTVDADVLTAKLAGPMLAKAWAEFTGRTDNDACTVAYSNNITSITRTDTGDYSVVFTTALPSDKYTVMATGWNASPTNDFSFGRITARVATGVSCTVTYGKVEAVTTPQDPTGIATIIFFGSTS
jgi:hypothetical protein|tara:strand:+ start:914 stop:1882 length:969 start_codon:yes stop_codon:yes gene_type:complete